jgi:hypothetical protein
MISEVRAGLAAMDTRGVWALAKGSSSLWWHGGLDGDAAGPNSKEPWADNILNGPEILAAVGIKTLLHEMPCYYVESVFSNQQTARSMHQGGVFVCMADGSVRWISDFIQARPSTEASLSVLDRLLVSKDGQVLSGTEY